MWHPSRGIEKAITQVLVEEYTSHGWLVLQEFQLRAKDFQLDSFQLGKSRIQIDLACYHPTLEMFEFVETEPAAWPYHPLTFRPFAHKVYLAYDYQQNSSPFTKPQILWAVQRGLGIYAVDLGTKTIHTIPATVQPLGKAIHKKVKELFFKQSKRRNKDTQAGKKEDDQGSSFTSVAQDKRPSQVQFNISSFSLSSSSSSFPASSFTSSPSPSSFPTSSFSSFSFSSSSQANSLFTSFTPGLFQHSSSGSSEIEDKTARASGILRVERDFSVEITNELSSLSQPVVPALLDQGKSEQKTQFSTSTPSKKQEEYVFEVQLKSSRSSLLFAKIIYKPFLLALFHQGWKEETTLNTCIMP